MSHPPEPDHVPRQLPPRIRHHGKNRRAQGPLLRRANGAFADPLRHRHGPHAARSHPRLRHPEKGLRAGEPRPRQAHARPDRPDRQSRRRSRRGQARQPFPPARLADRQRHAEQHERQRGHLQPRHRDGRRRHRLEEAGASQRPREHVAVLQRHLPRRDVDCRHARNGAHPAARGEACCATRSKSSRTNSPTS